MVYGLEKDIKFVETELAKMKIENLYMFLSKCDCVKNEKIYAEDEIRNLSYYDISNLISLNYDYYSKNGQAEELILSKLVRACSRILLNENSRFIYDQKLRRNLRKNKTLKLENEIK